MTGPSLYVLLLAVGVVLCLAITVVAWRHRPAPGATPLTGLSFGAAIWSFATLAQVLLDGHHASLFWGRLAYVGITLGGTCWFLLTLEYARKERYLRSAFVGLLAIEPIVVNALIWTNGSHGLVWAHVEADASVYGYFVEYGPAFWIHAAYSYALLAAGSLLVLGQLYRHRSIYRGQAFAMLVSALAPWLGNALFLAEATSADWAPIGFVVSTLALFWAMLARNFVDVTPVARDTVLDRIPSGVAVVDGDDRVLDVNAEMERLLGCDYDRLVGNPADEAFAEWPALEAVVANRRDGSHEVALATDGDARYFDVEIEPLIDDLGRRIGRIALVHDVTEQRRRERELERQNEQLDRFSGVLSHDLRNPLNVAAGYVNLIEETGELDHVDRVRSAHERMDDLITDVRTLVKQGQTISEVDRLDLADVARDAAANVDTRAADLRIEDDLGIVEADENRLLHAFENLFRNAVEHGSTSPDSQARQDAVEHSSTSPRSASPHEDAIEHGVETSAPAAADRRRSTDGGEGGTSGGTDAPNGTDGSSEPDDAEVTITVGRLDGDSAGRAGFFVADDGPGIPADEREKIFESGYTTGDDGTGLGLAIVQNAVEAHGWEIDVTESEAQGARFEVSDVTFLDE